MQNTEIYCVFLNRLKGHGMHNVCIMCNEYKGGTFILHCIQGC